MIVNFFALFLWPYRAWSRRFAAAKKSVLTVSVSGVIEEISAPRRLSFLQRFQQRRPTFFALRFSRAAGAALVDPRVRGLRLRLEPFDGGWAAAESLREIVQRFAEKKPVWCELPKGG